MVVQYKACLGGHATKVDMSMKKKPVNALKRFAAIFPIVGIVLFAPAETIHVPSEVLADITKRSILRARRFPSRALKVPPKPPSMAGI